MNATPSGRSTFRRRLVTVVVALLMLVLGGLIGYLARQQLWARQHYQTAQAALARKDFPTAADHLARCLEVWAHDRATLLLAARTTRRAGQLQEAQRLQEACERRSGSFPELTLERTLLAVQNGQLQDREQFLQGLV